MQNLRRYTLCLLAAMFLVNLSYSQESDTAPTLSKFKRVCRAYGLLESQEYSLNKIVRKYPDLELEVLRARSLFNSTYGQSRKNIEAYLKETYPTEYVKFIHDVSVEIDRLSKTQEIDREGALLFLNTVEKHAKGDIESPILETLLSFQYQDHPEDEFLNKNIKTFKTKNHPKAKGTDWQINVPKSWYQKEGERPNIIQTFTSDFGDGYQMISLIVLDLTLENGGNPSEAMKAGLYSEKIIKAHLPKDSRFISSMKVTLDNYPGGMSIIERSVTRLDETSKLRIIEYSFHRKNKAYRLQCVIGGEPKDDLDIPMQKFLPLFRLVANSLVENEQYK